MRNKSTMYVIKKNGHKTDVQKDNVSKIKKIKVHISILHPLKYKHSLYKKCPMLTLPLST